MAAFTVGWGLLVLALVYALVHASKTFNTNETDDEITAGIKTLFKVLFISSAIIVAVVGIGNTDNMVDGAIDADTNLNDNANLDNFINGSNSLYQGSLWTFIIFIAGMLVFVIYITMKNVQNNMANNRGGGFG